MDTKSVGMIGLGLMGTALSERLLEAGYTIWVHNRTREKAQPLVARGARWSDNPLAVCDRVLISLYTTDTVEEIRGRRQQRRDPGLCTATGIAAAGACVGRNMGAGKGQPKAVR